MAQRRARAKPAGTHVNGATNDGATNELAPAVETLQAFAREIAQMSGQALDRTTQRVEKLRRAQSKEEAAAIQAGFLREAMEHAVQHTRTYIFMLATFPHELVLPVNVAVATAEAARHATAAKVGRLSEGPIKLNATASRAGGPGARRCSARAALWSAKKHSGGPASSGVN